jgi:hypothetical protein
MSTVVVEQPAAIVPVPVPVRKTRPFPIVTVTDGVATFVLKSEGNHYAHRATVPADALDFFRTLWAKCPFRVTTGGKAKKLVMCNGVFVHDLWLASKGLDMRDRKSHCRNHNWLDWTNDNVYVPTMTRTGKSITESEQKRFEHMSRAGQISNFAPEGMQSSPLELIDARKRGPKRARQNANAMSIQSLRLDTGIKRQVRTKGSHGPLKMPRRCRRSGADLSTLMTTVRMKTANRCYQSTGRKPRTDDHEPAGWEPKRLRDSEDTEN